MTASHLIVTVAIVGILVAVGYPRVAILAISYRLQGAARNLAVDLQRVHGRAIAEGKCFQVTFDTSAKTYQVLNKAGVAACGTTGFANDGAAKQIDDVNLISIDDGGGSTPASPVFNPRGGVSTTSTIRLSNTTNAALTINVQSTGRIYVQ